LSVPDEGYSCALNLTFTFFITITESIPLLVDYSSPRVLSA